MEDSNLLSDKIYEQIVEKKRYPKDYLKLFGGMAAGIIILLAALYIPYIQNVWLAAFALVLYGEYRFYNYMYIEYEYSFISGELTIDIIRGRRNRKTLFKGECRELEALEEHGSKTYDSITNRAEAVSSMDSEGIYFIIGQFEGSKKIVFFEPDNKLLEKCMAAMPRRTHY